MTTNILDMNGRQLNNMDVIDIHQTVNGQNLFVVLDVETLDVRYFHDLDCKYEYDVQELFRACRFTGEVEFEIVNTL
jgi:hypothetical protein